jgi:ABC-type polysaccharide/polyol phosphate transport system ATPase subunit
MAPAVAFHHVSKKFRRGERHDSLRDLIPSLLRLRRRRAEDLGPQEFWALRDVSFEVHRGEALGIIGPNGAGKSTSLKVLTRILKPTSGERIVRGRVGALIEVAAGFHPDLTGRENVFLQGAIMGMTKAETIQRFDEIVAFAGVDDFIDTPVKRYSSGMNARLGFSIAAHLRPDALIIDEVLSVGDMSFQQRCYDRMLEFKRQGIAIVMVSHNLQAVSTLCDKAVYLKGEVRASGPTADVLAAYVRAQDPPKTTADASSPVQITSVAYEGGGDTHRDVPSGSSLRLTVRCEARVPLDDVTFGFLVHRSTDHLLVYDGNIHRRELAPLPLEGGFSVDFGFSPHVVRGHYYVSVHIMDNPSQTFVLPKQPCATFAVNERRSWGGVADVELTGRLTT